MSKEITLKVPGEECRKKYPILSALKPELFDGKILDLIEGDLVVLDKGKQGLVLANDEWAFKIYKAPVEDPVPIGHRFKLEHNDGSGDATFLEVDDVWCDSNITEVLANQTMSEGCRNIYKLSYCGIMDDERLMLQMPRYHEVLLEDLPDAPAALASTVLQVLHTIGYLHSAHGICHNDLHCSNVLLTPTTSRTLRYVRGGQVWTFPSGGVIARVIDFGHMARWRRDGGNKVRVISLTVPGNVDCFPTYDCPEFDVLKFLVTLGDQYPLLVADCPVARASLGYLLGGREVGELLDESGRIDLKKLPLIRGRTPGAILDHLRGAGMLDSEEPATDAELMCTY